MDEELSALLLIPEGKLEHSGPVTRPESINVHVENNRISGAISGFLVDAEEILRLSWSITLKEMLYQDFIDGHWELRVETEYGDLALDGKNEHYYKEFIKEQLVNFPVILVENESLTFEENEDTFKPREVTIISRGILFDLRRISIVSWEVSSTMLEREFYATPTHYSNQWHTSLERQDHQSIPPHVSNSYKPLIKEHVIERLVPTIDLFPGTETEEP